MGIKVKVNLSLCLIKHHTMKYGGVPRIPNHNIRWSRLVNLCIGRPLYPRGNNLRTQLDRRLGCPQRQFGGCFCQESNTDYPVVQPVG
jgi:hypothetical protein